MTVLTRSRISSKISLKHPTLNPLSLTIRRQRATVSYLTSSQMAASHCVTLTQYCPTTLVDAVMN